MGHVKRYTMSTDALAEAADRLLPLADELVAPVAVAEGDFFFQPVAAANQIAWDFSNSLLSPVCVLYPQRETLFEFEVRAGEPPELKWSLDETRRIIFGIRPCDTHAIVYLDRFLAGGDFVDSQYDARRRNTKLVTMACAEPATENCWCSCCEGGPVAQEGFDVQLTPLGEIYLVEVAEGGAGIAEAWAELLEPAEGREAELFATRDKLVQRAKEAMEVNAHIGAAMRRVTAGAVPEELWADVGARCAGCGGCSFVCPKCTCFNVIDQMLSAEAGRRVREKDSCRFAGYSLEASGHNPRPDRADRAKRWSYHKLSYRYMERNDYHGCVGCGRCVTVCMGRVDMPTVAKQVREVGRGATASAAG